VRRPLSLRRRPGAYDGAALTFSDTAGVAVEEDQVTAGAAALDADRNGASEADALVRQYRAPLKRFFERRIQDRANAEDLAQEVLLRLARQHSLVRQTRPAYIFLTARSVLLDRVRRNRVREQGGLHENDESQLEVPSAERVCLAQERLARVEKLLEELTPRAREVFMMHRVEGLAYTEIAQALGITTSTVEKHMSAALRFLMQHAHEIEG
jgi:RNA polymerase sigma factor (sigma-70 family)